MITLKDIKISRNRIPLQNALWIRPMGGFVFKIYYPHGGDWTEMTTSEGSPSGDIKELEAKVSSLEEQVNSFSSTLDVLMRANARTGLRIENIYSMIEGLTSSVEKLYKIEYSDAIDVTALPPKDWDNADIDLSKYGIDAVALNMLIDGEVVKANVSGYNRAFKVSTIKSGIPSAFANPWLVVTMTLKESLKRTVIYIMGNAIQLIGGPQQLQYSIWYEEEAIDDSVLYIQESFKKEEQEGLSELNLLNMGISSSALSDILNGTVDTVLFGDTYIKFVISDINDEEESRAFSLYGYDQFNHKTLAYYFNGSYNNEWLYSIGYEELDGYHVPEE